MDQVERSNLLNLSEDVLLVIFKFLHKNDVDNLSVASKDGFEKTKKYYESQTHLKISRPVFLSFQDFETLAMLKRDYKSVLVDMRGGRYLYQKIIFDQLKLLNIVPTAAYVDMIGFPDIEKLKQNYGKTVKYFYIDSNDCIESLEHIEKYSNLNDPTVKIRKLKLNLSDNEKGCYDADFFDKFLTTFSGLHELNITVSTSTRILLHDKYNPKPHNIQKVSFSSKLPESETITPNFLKIFKGLNTIILDLRSNITSIRTLLEVNKRTLRRLAMEHSLYSAKTFKIPCQLEELEIEQHLSLERRATIEDFLINQNHLKSLKLSASLINTSLDSLGSHCAYKLDVSGCGPVARDIPELPMVKHLIVNNRLLGYFLRRTSTLETLEITCLKLFESSSRYKPKCSELDLTNLKELNIAEGCLGDFSRENFKLPKLEKLRCEEFYMYFLKRHSSTLKFLEILKCGLNLDQFISVCDNMKGLETLKLDVDLGSLPAIVDYLEFSVELDGKLEFVEIQSKTSSKDDLELLHGRIGGQKCFRNFDDEEDIDYTKVHTWFNVKTKNCMYILYSAISQAYCFKRIPIRF